MFSAGVSVSFNTLAVPAYVLLTCNAPETETTGALGPSPSKSRLTKVTVVPPPCGIKVTSKVVITSSSLMISGSSFEQDVSVIAIIVLNTKIYFFIFLFFKIFNN